MQASKQEQQEKASSRPVRGGWQQMNRKQRREWIRKIQAEELSLQVVHPDAAGIDIGNEAHYVTVPPDRDSQPVRRFGCTTAELKDMAGVAEAMQDLPCGHAIDGGVLDRRLRSSGTGWV